MSDTSIQSVIYVCREEAARLRELVRDLDAAEPRRLEGILRSLSKTGDTLSAALTRVSAYIDTIEADEQEETKAPSPKADASLLEVVQRLRVAETFGFCPTCHGVKDDGGGHTRLEVKVADDHARVRALEAEARN